jgi:hypothetical protein
MIINNFNIFRSFRRPYKAYAELIVYADAVLFGSTAFQGFKPVAWRNLQISKLTRAVQHSKLSHRNSFNVDKLPDTLSFKKKFRICTFERDYRHNRIVPDGVSIVKR